MLTAHATAGVDRPGRYLVQFCRHAAAMGRTTGGHRPPPHAAVAGLQVSAEWTDTDGVVTFTPWGRCTLHATGTALTLRVDATDDDALHQIQDIIARDLHRFGRRQNLTITWQPSLDGDAGPAPPNRRRRGTTILITALVVLAAALHLGAAAGILAGGWPSLSADVLLALVAGKLLLMALGKRALHHRRTRRPGRRTAG